MNQRRYHSPVGRVGARGRRAAVLRVESLEDRRLLANTDLPLLPGTGVNLTGVEGMPITDAVGTFTDSDPSANLSNTKYAATIDWGDGTPGNPDITPGMVTQTGNVFTVVPIPSMSPSTPIT